VHPPWFGEGIPGPVTIDVFHVAHPDADHVVHPGAHRDSAAGRSVPVARRPQHGGAEPVTGQRSEFDAQAVFV